MAGSINDNNLGGWYSYRAAKAALNMLIKTASIEVKRKLPRNLESLKSTFLLLITLA